MHMPHLSTTVPYLPLLYRLDPFIYPLQIILPFRVRSQPVMVLCSRAIVFFIICLLAWT